MAGGGERRRAADPAASLLRDSMRVPVGSMRGSIGGQSTGSTHVARAHAQRREFH
eukprot:gene54715-9638_t